MKRNFLLTTLAAAGMLLLGSAPSFAACPAGTVGTQLAAGLWTVKIEGFKTDTSTCGSSCPDPTPQGEGCFGVIQSDGACDITGGDLICSTPTGGITAPTTVGGVPAFGGTASPANDVGSYFFNSNNTGEVNIQDNTSGRVFSFGVEAGLGNGVFQGASLFGPPGVQQDPLILTIQKRNQTITTAQFLTATSVAFDPAGGGSGGNGLGKGFDAVGVATAQHFDPETGTTVEGGGSIFFNVDGGYDSDVFPGAQIFPSSLVCDFHTTLLQLNTGGGQDGTELTNATLNGDFSCPLGGAAFETASVLYGATNGAAYIATTGAGGAPASGLAIANGTKMIAAGSDQGQPETLVASNANPHPSKTATITNKSTEPLDWTSITINGVSFVTITGGTCSAVGGDLPAWNPVASPTPPTCTIIFTDTGTTCNTGVNKQVGTYELNGADHAMISGTNTPTGVTFGLTCE